MQAFWRDTVEFFPILMSGVALTIIVTIGSLLLSTALGLVWALMRVSGIGVLTGFSGGLINVIRGIPIIVLLFYLYFVMPEFGITLSALQAAILGLGIAYSAYQAENFRAGIEAIDKGQREASLSLGLTPRQAMVDVIAPQAWRIALPPVGNYVVGLLKDTSIASIIAAPELMLRAKDLASMSFMPMQLYVLVGVIYFLMSFPLALAIRRLERRITAVRRA